MTQSDIVAPARGEEVLTRIAERRGHVWPIHHIMAELAPDFLDEFDRIYCQTLAVVQPSDADGLAIAHRELICACACAMMPLPIEVTAHHLERAFAHGLTERQAMQGFAALMIPAGGVAVSNGARALLYLREQAGRTDHADGDR